MNTSGSGNYRCCCPQQPAFLSTILRTSLLSLLLLVSVGSAKRRCKDGVNEGDIVARLQKNYTNKHILPDEDGIVVDVELHVQVRLNQLFTFLCG